MQRFIAILAGSGAVVAIALLAVVSSGTRQPVGAVLQYQFQTPADGQSFQPEDWRKALDRRVNSDIKQADVAVSPDGRVTVGVYGDDAERVERIRWRLGRRGTAQFRVLAHPQAHADLATRAQESTEALVTNQHGERVGLWVPIALDEQGQPRAPLSEGEAVLRTHDGRTHALLLISEHDINASHFQKVIYGSRRGSGYELDYYLTVPGALAQQKLSQEHLPHLEGVTQRLGFVLDGELWGTQPMTEELADRGSIPGPFTSDEIRDLMAVYGFNNYDRIPTGGILPAPLELVSIGETTEQPAPADAGS